MAPAEFRRRYHRGSGTTRAKPGRRNHHPEACARVKRRRDASGVSGRAACRRSGGGRRLRTHLRYVRGSAHIGRNLSALSARWRLSGSHVGIRYSRINHGRPSASVQAGRAPSAFDRGNSSVAAEGSIQFLEGACRGRAADSNPTGGPGRRRGASRVNGLGRTRGRTSHRGNSSSWTAGQGRAS